MQIIFGKYALNLDDTLTNLGINRILTNQIKFNLKWNNLCTKGDIAIHSVWLFGCESAAAPFSQSPTSIPTPTPTITNNEPTTSPTPCGSNQRILPGQLTTTSQSGTINGLTDLSDDTYIYDENDATIIQIGGSTDSRFKSDITISESYQITNIILQGRRFNCAPNDISITFNNQQNTLKFDVTQSKTITELGGFGWYMELNLPDTLTANGGIDKVVTNSIGIDIAWIMFAQPL